MIQFRDTQADGYAITRQATKTDLVDMARALGAPAHDEHTVEKIRSLIASKLPGVTLDTSRQATKKDLLGLARALGVEDVSGSTATGELRVAIRERLTQRGTLVWHAGEVALTPKGLGLVLEVGARAEVRLLEPPGEVLTFWPGELKPRPSTPAPSDDPPPTESAPSPAASGDALSVPALADQATEKVYARFCAELDSGKLFEYGASSQASRQHFRRGNGWMKQPTRRTAELLSRLGLLAEIRPELTEVALEIVRLVNPHASIAEWGEQTYRAAGEALAREFDDVDRRSGPEGPQLRRRDVVRHYTRIERLLVLEILHSFGGSYTGPGWCAQRLAEEAGFLHQLQRVTDPSGARPR